jgi:hypothetical protein
VRPTAKPKTTTRTQKGFLRMHWHVGIKVKKGKVAATLRSTKANSCTVSLSSRGDIWLSDAHGRNLVAVAARVPAGRYGIDVWCKVRQPRRAALNVRAIFAS